MVGNPEVIAGLPRSRYVPVEADFAGRGVSGVSRFQQLMRFHHAEYFDWDDLVRRDANIDRGKICAACAHRFRFLMELTADEEWPARDPHQWEEGVAERELRQA